MLVLYRSLNITITLCLNQLEGIILLLIFLYTITSVKMQVCKFLEVSLLSFLPEYGPKLKEDYVTVRHLPKIEMGSKGRCCSSCCFSFCSSNWQKVLKISDDLFYFTNMMLTCI
jgi:hypothetical protein